MGLAPVKLYIVVSAGSGETTLLLAAVPLYVVGAWGTTTTMSLAASTSSTTIALACTLFGLENE